MVKIKDHGDNSKPIVGLIAFANDGGLGAQTRRLSQILNPDRILIIDSSGFSKNKTQHFEWYPHDKSFLASMFPPSNSDVKNFLSGLTHVLVCENPYNFGLIHWGHEMGVKIFVQSNYEFCDNIAQPWLPHPDLFLMPSTWKLSEMMSYFGKNKVRYLPPPIDLDEFKKNREINLARLGKKRRFVHIIGTGAAEDRNGTFDLLDAIKLCKEDFQIVIRSQHVLPMDAFLDDPRVTYEAGSFSTNSALFEDFDALLLPRRWGGLCLPMIEALASSLPVVMSDISPNCDTLPTDWLIPATHKGSFQSRVGSIDCYSTVPLLLAGKIDELAKMSEDDLFKMKMKAYNIAVENWSAEVLKPKYLDLFNNR